MKNKFSENDCNLPFSVNESTGLGNGDGILSPDIMESQIGDREENGSGFLDSRLKYCTAVRLAICTGRVCLSFNWKKSTDKPLACSKYTFT